MEQTVPNEIGQCKKTREKYIKISGTTIESAEIVGNKYILYILAKSYKLFYLTTNIYYN